MAVPVPRVIDDYELTEPLAGSVHRARQRSTGREVALKVLPADGALHATDRFLREARAATTLDHPNVVRCLGCGEEGGLRWVAMELVAGADLERVSAAELRLPERRALKIVRDCCRALMAMERAGLGPHGAIEPRNVVVNQDGIAKLADLALCRARTKDDTTAFTPPERVAGSGEPDARGDVHALGALLFFLLTGRPPYEGDKGLSIGNRVLHFPVPDLRSAASVSDATAALARKAMDKDPAERFQTAAELHAAIERALTLLGASSTVRALPLRRWRAPEGGSRVALAAALAAGGLLLLGGGGAWLAWRRPDDAVASAPGATAPAPGAAALVQPSLGGSPPEAPAPVPSAAATEKARGPAPVALRALQVPVDGERCWSFDRGRCSVDPVGPLARVWLDDPAEEPRRLPLTVRWTIDRVVVERECTARRASPSRPGFYCSLGIRARRASIDRASQIAGAALWLELRFEPSRAHGMLVVANQDNVGKTEGNVVRPSAEPGGDRLPPGHDRLDEFVLGGFSRSETLEVVMALDPVGWRVDVRRDGGAPLSRAAGWREGEAPITTELAGGAFVWAEVGNHLDGDGRGAVTCVVDDGR